MTPLSPEGARELITSLPTAQQIEAAVHEQLPRGLWYYPDSWLPLTINGQEYYIMGHEVITLQEMERRTALWVAGDKQALKGCAQ